jgi:hypothetical protein
MGHLFFSIIYEFYFSSFRNQQVIEMLLSIFNEFGRIFLTRLMLVESYES